ERLRFMSPHPHYMDDKLIEAMAATPAVCEHIHLPIQSGSNRILSLMRRNYTRELYAGIAQRLRSAIPGISITTDIIVGFPSETEAEFEETLNFIQEISFDGAYCFKFSPRDATEAANHEGQLPQSLKEERLSRLLALTDNLGRAKAKSQIGRKVKVLWETHGEGRTRNNWIFRPLEPAQISPGFTNQVTIEAVKNRLLLGRLSLE
ncbi:MAG: radical SAM protein, partial [Elusimicrobiota bacterium]